MPWLSVVTVYSSGWWYTNCRKGLSRPSEFLSSSDWMNRNKPVRSCSATAPTCYRRLSAYVRVAAASEWPKEMQNVRTTTLCVFLSAVRSLLGQQRREVLHATETMTNGQKPVCCSCRPSEYEIAGRTRRSCCHCLHHYDHSMFNKRAVVERMKLSVHVRYEPVAGPSWTKDDNAVSAAHNSGASL
jgi:hypothetical protein